MTKEGNIPAARRPCSVVLVVACSRWRRATKRRVHHAGEGVLGTCLCSKVPISLGMLRPHLIIVCTHVGPPNGIPAGQFSRFCTAHPCAPHSDIQTHRPRCVQHLKLYSPHLYYCMYAVRTNKIDQTSEMSTSTWLVLTPHYVS